MSAPRSLSEIATQLEALADPGDFEDAHMEADDLLIEAIKRVASPSDAKRIAAAFDAVPKWYA